MGTTLTGAFSAGSDLFVASVGDIIAIAARPVNRRLPDDLLLRAGAVLLKLSDFTRTLHPNRP